MPPAATTRPPLRRYLRRTAVGFAVLVAVSVVVVLSLRYRQLHQPSGTAASATPVPARCRLDPAVLAQTHTQNFEQVNDASDEHFPEGGDVNVLCSWGQVRERDGINPRHLDFHVSRFDDARGVGEASHQYDLQSQMPYAMGRRTDTAVPGLGDEAAFAVTTDRGGQSLMRLAVRQGNLLVDVYLRGEDRHLLWTTQMPADEAQQLATSVAQELLHRSW